MADDKKDLIETLLYCLTSPNIPDANLESSNIVDALYRVERSILLLALATWAPQGSQEPDHYVNRMMTDLAKRMCEG